MYSHREINTLAQQNIVSASWVIRRSMQKFRERHVSNNFLGILFIRQRLFMKGDSNMKTVLKGLKGIIRRLLASRGWVIVGQSSGYIDAKETIAAARREGLSICDYVEKMWQKKGDTAKVIDEMDQHGAFAVKNPRVVEIGTGTGRYLEKVLERTNPKSYESYETAVDWADWLQAEFGVISHEADGCSLRQTPDRTAELVHAHGVFVYLPFLVSYQYWKEIWRITKTGGTVVFDIISEDCLDEATVEQWISAGITYPCFVSKAFLVLLFEAHGFSLLTSFKQRYGEGLSEYLILRRDKPTRTSAE